jgi:hypothetical protein
MLNLVILEATTVFQELRVIEIGYQGISRNHWLYTGTCGRLL